MTAVSAVAQDLLDAATAAIDAPSRRLVTVGQPTDPLASDAQLAVGFVRWFEGQPGLEQPTAPAQVYSPRTAEFLVRLVRPVHTSTSAADSDPAAITAASKAIVDEGSALVAAVYRWEPAGGDGSPFEKWVGPLAGVRPQGLVHAVQFLVHVST